MGQVPSCSRPSIERQFFAAAKTGQIDVADLILRQDPSFIRRTTAYLRLSSIHIAAAQGQFEMLSMLLERLNEPDLLTRQKQTPLMLAAMNGNLSCVFKLLQAGANILMFDSFHGRTCLHYAACHGHLDCLQAILQAARSNPISESWGFTRFVNIRDGKGATPLHLAAKRRRPDCVRALLEEGAIVCASSHDNGHHGSTPLHLAARGGCLDSVRYLLAWGADRLQMDSSGRIPYAIAVKKGHMVCAALLNPSSAEPLVWPSSLMCIRELKHDAKLLLESALMKANREREEKIFKSMSYSLPCKSMEESIDVEDSLEADENEPCSICFDRACLIEVRDCGHQMCARCTLAICCHCKPNPMNRLAAAPICPFCRSGIARLEAILRETGEAAAIDRSPERRVSRKSRNSSEGSSSFKSLSSAMSSFGRAGGRSSGHVSGTFDTIDKL